MVDVLWEFKKEEITTRDEGYRQTNRRVLEGALLGDDLMSTSRCFCNFRVTHSYRGVLWRLGFSLHTKLLGFTHRSRIVDELNRICIVEAAAFQYDKHLHNSAYPMAPNSRQTPTRP